MLYNLINTDAACALVVPALGLKFPFSSPVIIPAQYAHLTESIAYSAISFTSEYVISSLSKLYPLVLHGDII